MKNIIFPLFLVCSFNITINAQDSLLYNKSWKTEAHYVSLQGEILSMFHLDSSINRVDLSFMRTSFNPDGSFDAIRNNNTTYSGIWSIDTINNQFISNLDTFNILTFSDTAFCLRSHELHLVDGSGTIDTIFYYTKNIPDTDPPSSCPISGINFSSQSQLDSFPILYPDCDFIEGDLTINPKSGSINSLNALSQLTGVGGNLIIRNTAINNLNGLENITTIGDALWINQNEQLTSLSGLNNLNSIDGMLSINQNDLLISLSGLNNLNTIGDNLRLGNNVSLNSLNGLDNLLSIDGALIIEGHPSLQNISALSTLTSINGTLYLVNNSAITNLYGLQNVDPDGIGHLVLKNCKELAFCQLENICNYLDAGRSYDIRGNISDCENINNLNAACDQRCPEEIILYTQSEVDNFYLNHAGCINFPGRLVVRDDWSDPIYNLDGLQQLTSIGGDLYLYRNNFLTDFSGLSNINYVGGRLYLNWHPYIENISGFENIDSIGGGLFLDRNAAIQDLSGFTNLKKVGEDLYINNMDALTDLSGLPPGLEIGGDLRIGRNDELTDLSHIGSLANFGGLSLIDNNSLTSLTSLPPITHLSGILRIHSSELTDLSGLESLTSIDGDLVIYANYDLENLNALENLTSIDGELTVYLNNFLTNLEPLQNIDPVTITGLTIQNNQRLSICEIEPICSYLENGDTYLIVDNNLGCNSSDEITERCGMACSSGDLIFSTQEEIDDFSINYPDCDKIIGDVMIMESSPGIITNLAGLGQIESITGNVEITNNTNLPNLSGLDQLTRVGGDFNLSNNNTLVDVFGLDQLTSISGSFTIQNNGALNDLGMLESLEKIGGNLEISHNEVLESLSGLGNVNHEFIDSLTLIASSSLSTCNVASICNYLNEGNPATISGNATGCNSIAETTASCNDFCLLDGITFNTQQDLDDFAINYPNCSEIFGDVIIIEATNASISDLSPLSNITKIHGDFLNYRNDQLVDFAALQNLTFIGGNFQIRSHNALTSLTGLENLTVVGGDFLLLYNYNLENLAGLSNLVSIGEDFSIDSNRSLQDLKGLENLLTIGEGLTIRGNTNLSSLNGIQNLESGSPQALNLRSNYNLSTCEIESICNYLGNNNSTLKLYNKKGCDNYLEVQNRCGKACLYEGIVLTSQAEIDAFSNNNLTCEKIIGDVLIQEANPGNITNLSGLSQLTAIAGKLTIRNNQLLENLSGLNQLTSVSAGILIDNNTSLTTLQGLNQLVEIENELIISNNPALNDMTALTKLKTIDGTLQILNNDALPSLTGLDFIEYQIIDSLVLVGSENLSICDVFPMCNYIQTGGVATISGNAIGCMDIAELSSACNDQCLLDGIEFNTQSDIDNFVVNYPGCTRIAGDVSISDTGGGDITNLDGLNPLTKIYGDLTIIGNNNLTTLAPLEHLNYVRHELHIRENQKLLNLEGVENMEEIGKLTIRNNHGLKELVRFNNLERVNGGISITNNDSLNLVGGMDNLQAIASGLNLSNNNQLVEVAGFQQLTAIGGQLYLGDNEVLTTIGGFENLASVGSDLKIGNHPLLSELNFIQSITSIGRDVTIDYNDALTDFDFTNLEVLGGNLLIENNILLENASVGNLTRIGGDLNLQQNAMLTDLEGFENVSTIGGSFIIKVSPSLSTLNGINNLDSIGVDLELNNADLLTDISGLEHLNYVGNDVYFRAIEPTSLSPLSNLGTIGGDLEMIYCSGFNDLSGLESITSIEGNLNFYGNDDLVSFTGLENLNNVSGDLRITSNDDLTDLEGLQTLSSIGGQLYIYDNERLENLNALENLTSMNGILSIVFNDDLTTLEGLRNIDFNGITNLKIRDNNNLSLCSVESICNYLQGDGPYFITGNSTNCYSASQIQATCLTVLPVELLSFHGKKEENVIRLNWETANEENNLGFEIQKSDNGTDWTILDWVDGQGTSNQLHQYSYLDKFPYLGNNYYRLKQLDLDGRYTFSNIVLIRSNENNTDIKVTPNPSDGQFEVVILNPEKEKMKITLYDNTGQVIWNSGLIKDLDIWRRNFDLKKQSIYFLSAQIGRNNLSEKIVVIDEN